MHFLITAGGTREYIDTVRFISNASSGKTGYALARVAIRAGHKVTLITAVTNLKPPAKAKIITVVSSREIFAAVKKEFAGCDCLIMAAAVADFTVAAPAKTKIKKAPKPLTVKLKPAPDTLMWAGRNKKKKQLVVGFALEDTAVRANAEKKLKEKNLDMIIANTPAAIGSDESELQIKSSGGKWIELPPARKTKNAKIIIRMLEDLFAQCL